MSRSNVFVRSVAHTPVETAVREIMEGVDYRSIIAPGARVVIKVNLSTPFMENAEASNTHPAILDAVLSMVRERTDSIVVGESNGMRYATEDAFEVSGYNPIIAKHGARAMNFSKDEWVESGEAEIRGWPLSRTLLEADVFITLPVLKTHATTVFTGALKNQFGCYPQHNRILLHPKLDRVLVLINKIAKPRIAIMDGIVAMEGRGPINGRPRRFNVILGSRDAVALDATAMRLVGIDPTTSRHVRWAAQEGLGQIAAENIDIDGDFDGLKTTFEPAELDLPIRALGWNLALEIPHRALDSQSGKLLSSPPRSDGVPRGSRFLSGPGGLAAELTAVPEIPFVAIWARVARACRTSRRPVVSYRCPCSRPLPWNGACSSDADFSRLTSLVPALVLAFTVWWVRVTTLSASPRRPRRELARRGAVTGPRERIVPCHACMPAESYPSPPRSWLRGPPQPAPRPTMSRPAATTRMRERRARRGARCRRPRTPCAPETW